MNKIRTDYNRIYHNTKIKYEIGWEEINQIMTKRNGRKLNGSQHGGFAMENDGTQRIQSAWLGTEWITTLQYSIEYDRRQQIRLGQKGIEWIAT